MDNGGSQEAGKKGSGVNVRSSRDVSRLLVEMFGVDPGPVRGVIHVAAVAGDSEPRKVLRITPQTPKSPHDGFVLSMARARANVIITTGQIVREEPELTHGYIGPHQMQLALDEWRRKVVGISDDVAILVLTSGRDLDPAHPLFSGPRAVTIYTSPEGATALQERSFQACEVVAEKDPSIRKVIGFAKATCGAATVSIEAGPSTTPPLYDAPVAIDELLLSTFHGPVGSALLGGTFIDRRRLHSVFGSSSSYAVRSRDGEWSFNRFAR